VRFRLGAFTALLAAAAMASIPAWSFKGSNEGQLVDSGAFGIFRQGRRIGTETFTIHQGPDVSVVAAIRASAVGDLVLPGNIQAVTEAPILARADGYVKRRLVDIGDRVTAGQLLA